MFRGVFWAFFGRLLSPSAGHDHIYVPAAALAADEPFTPFRDSYLGTVTLSHLGGIGLALVATIEPPGNQPQTGRSGVAEGDFGEFLSDLIVAQFRAEVTQKNRPYP